MKKKDLKIPTPRRPINSGAGPHKTDESLQNKGNIANDGDFDYHDDFDSEEDVKSDSPFHDTIDFLDTRVPE